MWSELDEDANNESWGFNQFRVFTYHEGDDCGFNSGGDEDYCLLTSNFHDVNES